MIWIASASVPVRLPEPEKVWGIPDSSATSARSSKTTGESVEPRLITGPVPRWWLPSWFSSMPGASVACVTSTATASVGSRWKAAVRAP